MFCKPHRRSLQPLLPEEAVRQDLLNLMVDKLNYPGELLAVEVELGSIPHLLSMKDSLPKRRADIICFAKKITPAYELYPLLMIECKAIKLTPSAIEQIRGYNFYVNAFFLAVANSEEIKTFWFNERHGRYGSVDFLPSYDQLIKAVKEK